MMTDGGQGGPAETVDDGRHLLGLGIQSDGENDPGGIRIDLPPFQGRGITAELLCEQTCRYTQQKDTQGQAHNDHLRWLRNRS
jgi:hypothetical protein